MDGNIKVFEAEENYKRIAKDIIFDKEIDIVTLGVFVRIASCSQDWNLNVKGLSKSLGLSERKTRESIVLLEEKGYVRRIPIKNLLNQFEGWNYEVYNIPLDEDERSSAGKSPDLAVSDKSRIGQVQKCKDPNNRLNSNNRLKSNNKPKKENLKELLSFPYHSEEFMLWWDNLTSTKKWKPKSERQLQATLNEFAKHTEQECIDAMKKAFTGDYQGIFFDRKPTPQPNLFNQPQPQPQTRSRGVNMQEIAAQIKLKKEQGL